MKFKSFIRTFMFPAMTCCIIGMAAVSCTEKGPEGEEEVSYGNLQGVVKDTDGNPLAAVDVAVKDVEGTVQSDESGAFTFNNVPVKTQLVTFTKEGYGTVGMTVQKTSFTEGVAVLNPVMEMTNAKIEGTVLDLRNNGAPFAGVTVTAGTRSAVTGSDGKFLIDQLSAADYSVTFSADGVKTVTKTVTKDMFADGTATIEDVLMGGAELLRGLSVEELKDADKWYYDEYRGGKGNGGGVVDWSCVYLSTLKYVGQWENQNEGCTLQVRNSGEDQNNPADLENFDSFVYGSKKITEDNKVMTLYVRTHNAETKHVKWGVRVIDINDPFNPESELVGGVRDFSNTSYEDFTIDLSEYIGKEVIIAVGIFRAETGDYYNQFVIRKMSFAPEANRADDYLPGTPVAGLDGWHMTNEMVRSTMTNPLREFTGISSEPVDGKDGKGYNVWNGTDHIAAQWAFMYVNKDTEPTAAEGFVIKVRSDAPVNTVTPESYFYAKFAVDGGSDHLTFTTRNGDDLKYTYFKVTAISEDGTVNYLQPSAHKATQAEAAADGCWKFINNAGDSGNADAYATFEYDLSEFSGSNVVIAIGVFKGESVDGEQKLFMSNIKLD